MNSNILLKSKDRFNVLIVMATYSKAYPVIESLKKAGYNVIVGVDNMRNETSFSFFPDKIMHVVNPYISEKLYIASILKIIKENNIDIIVPIGFIDFLLLSKYKNILEKYTIIPVDAFEKIIALSNKWYISKLAKSLGVNYPKTLLLRENINITSIENFVNEVGLPVVVKGLGDASKPKFISDFSKLLDEVKQGSLNGSLLQEFIAGYGVGYFALGCDGEPVAEFMHKRILENTPLGGASVKASSNFDPELLYLGRKIVKEIKYTGVIMVEFKKNAETGDYYLIEINPKFWGSLELAYRAGVDFPKYLVDFFLKEEKPKRIIIKNVSFSWIINALSSYSQYGFKPIAEIVPKVLPRSPFLSDLHLCDLPNFALKSAYATFSILRTSSFKVKIGSIYITEHFKEILCKRKLDLIVSDLDGTFLKLNIPWEVMINDALEEGLIKQYAGISESFIKFWLMGDKVSFTKLSEFVKRYEVKAVRSVRKDECLSSLLRTIKQKSLHFAVVSLQSREAILECLKKLGILDYVDVVVSREDTPIRFEALLQVIKEINLDKPYYGIMFGDTLIDIKAAFKARLLPCRIAKNNIERLQAKGLGVSYTDSLTKVLKLIISSNYS